MRPSGDALGRAGPGRETKGRTMRNDHVTLRSTAVFDLLAPRTPAVPVKVELRYDTRDPYAVVAAFRTGRAGWVEWVYARDLLADPVDDTGIEPVTSSVSGKRSPAELIARGGDGIRTRVHGFAGRCLASRPLHRDRPESLSERMTGFEPATLTLAR